MISLANSARGVWINDLCFFLRWSSGEGDRGGGGRVDLGAERWATGKRCLERVRETGMLVLGLRMGAISWGHTMWKELSCGYCSAMAATWVETMLWKIRCQGIGNSGW